MFFQRILMASGLALSGLATAELEQRNPDLLGNLAGGLVPGMQSSSTPSSSAPTSSSPTPPSGFKRMAAPTAGKRDFLSDPLQQVNDGTSDSVLKRNADLLGGLLGGAVPGLSQSSTQASSAATPAPETPSNPILKRVAPTPTSGNAPNYRLPDERTPLNLAERDAQLEGPAPVNGLLQERDPQLGNLGPLNGLLGGQQNGASSSAPVSSSATPTASPSASSNPIPWMKRTDEAPAPTQPPVLD